MNMRWMGIPLVLWVGCGGAQVQPEWVYEQGTAVEKITEVLRLDHENCVNPQLNEAEKAEPAEKHAEILARKKQAGCDAVPQQLSNLEVVAKDLKSAAKKKDAKPEAKAAEPEAKAAEAKAADQPEKK